MKSGILNIDKPRGMTSFDIVRQVRRLCKTRKVGHAGTLDPLATGVLPVAIERATRLIEYVMAGEKTYQATLQLGASTDTQDSEGQLLRQRDWSHVDRVQLDQVLSGFVGEIQQLPPMYSALKKDGKPLYQLAREGLEVERQLRTIHIDSLTIDDFSPPHVTFTVCCSKGTYVRTLCHDIGEQLHCGAHMTALRRLQCGPFAAVDSVTLERLQQLAEQGSALPIVSPAEALADWSAITVDGDSLLRLRDGVAPAMGDLDVAAIKAGERVRLLAGNELVAIARFAPGGFGKRPGDFELIKVFPPAEEQT